MIVASRIQYFVCLGQGKDPIPWQPFESNQKINLHTDYFGKAFVSMEDYLEGGAWSIYLTWDLDSLPEYGDHVVAVVLGDEWGRIPRYADKVGALFKCYGIKSRPLVNLSNQFSYQKWLTWLKYFFALVKFLPGWLRYQKARFQHKKTGKAMPPVYTIPLGYANQAELPLVQFDKRPVDISFAGSIIHKTHPWWSLKRWIGTPKNISRKNMLTALEKLIRVKRTWHIDLKITPGFHAARSADTLEYSRRTMDAKISVVPRGNSFETFRFFEALRAGCVLITEHLPDYWFYRGAPVIRVDNWDELPVILDELMANPERLNRMHAQSLGWWRDICSEDALGRYMATQLNRLTTNPLAHEPDRRPIPLHSDWQHLLVQRNRARQK